MKNVLRATKLFLVMGISCLQAQDRPFTNRNHQLPLQARASLEVYQHPNQKVDAFVFTKDSEWLIIGEGKVTYSNILYFTSSGLLTVLSQHLDKGFQALSISPDNHWVVVLGNTAYYSNERYFERVGLKDKLSNLLRQNKKILSIAVGTDGSWVIIAPQNDVHYSRNLSQEYPDVVDFLEDCKQTGRRLKTFVFSPYISTARYARKHWAVVANDYGWTSMQGSLWDAFDHFRRKRLSMDVIALAPNSGWAVITNQVYTPPSNIIDRFENGLVLSDSSKANILDRMEAHTVKGLSITVIKNYRIAFSIGYGTRNVDTGTPVLAKTRFAIASMSKAVAAMAWLHLIESKRYNISLQDSLGSLVRKLRLRDGSPFFEWLNRSTPEAGNITIQQLLSNTSGLSEHGIGQDPIREVRSLSEILFPNGTRNAPLGFSQVGRITLAPNQFWDYSGGGFTVAQALFEAITQQNYTDYTTRHLLRPLGMNTSLWTPPMDQTDYAIGHTVSGRTVSLGDCPSETAGGLIATSEEYARFVLALLQDGRYEGKQIVSKWATDQMLTPRVAAATINPCNDTCYCWRPLSGQSQKVCATPFQNVDSSNNPKSDKFYGLGLELSKSYRNNYPSRMDHGGSHNGHRNRFWAYKDGGNAIIILTNADGDGTVNELINEIWRSFNTNFRN